ncbi:unnamed protein product [Prorocentrum cordatum]|uniref:Cysteine protease n=1 Tax=Prorocentrum cordatum TaxID=2364126 RepID=A0ABN9SK85_9DINO|nr:unnamed protein product [Polarella glacialis]CAK0832194.1 unnamed protein product [Polarella glacialis]
MQSRAGCPFHRSLDDGARDLGKDMSGTASFVAIGSVGKAFAPEADVPRALAAVRERDNWLRPGRGTRKVDSEPGTWREIAEALGLEAPEALLPRPVRLRIYCCPWDAKDVSPCEDGGVFSLAVCGTQVRQSLRKTAVEFPRLTSAVLAMRRGGVKALFLVGTLLEARSYHLHGIANHGLLPWRGRPGRGGPRRSRPVLGDDSD